jgi:hypothetical protein
LIGNPNTFFILLGMTELLTPAEKLWRYLAPWSADDCAFLTPNVRLQAHAQTGTVVFVERLVGTMPGHNDCSEALEKLCRLADAAHCSLLVLATPAEERWYGRYGFVWYRGHTKDVRVRRPQVRRN